MYHTLPESCVLGAATGVQSSMGNTWDSPVSLGSDQFSSGPGATSPRPSKKELSVVTVQSTNIAPKVSKTL